MLNKNVGGADKVVRVAVGVALGIGAYKASGILAIVLGVFAVVVILTALVGWCWLYALLGISTAKDQPPAAKG